ncbi:unnamed protein product [Prorocentrum cordatum]|uniref:Guanylate cyclase domain-containing protein n=1 Tax=Prorocentrum cordatum TaxID=2364126 RepID=A0ABN9RDI0_9DINO|nr:unnamed protein product [Polarella glacialis]
MEYTVLLLLLGDAVNLSARLMSNAPADGILVDEATKDQCTREVNFTPLERIKVKGKADAIQVFQPYLKVGKARIGIGHDGKIHFPWYVRPYSMSHGSAGRKEAAPPEAMEAQFKANVAQLCGLSDWEGIKQVTKLLGNKFRDSSRSRSQDVAMDISQRRDARANSKRLGPGATSHHATPRGSVHSNYLRTNVRASSMSSVAQGVDTTRAASLARMVAQGVPKGSPFIDGGIVVLEGNVGMGKIELAEEMVMYTHQNLYMVPIFGSIGPRLNDIERLGVELLLSTIGAFRHLDRSVWAPQDPLQALAKLLPSDGDDDLQEDSIRGRARGDGGLAGGPAAAAGDLPQGCGGAPRPAPAAGAVARGGPAGVRHQPVQEDEGPVRRFLERGRPPGEARAARRGGPRRGQAQPRDGALEVPRPRVIGTDG